MGKILKRALFPLILALALVSMFLMEPLMNGAYGGRKKSGWVVKPVVNSRVTKTGWPSDSLYKTYIDTLIDGDTMSMGEFSLYEQTNVAKQFISIHIQTRSLNTADTLVVHSQGAHLMNGVYYGDWYTIDRDTFLTAEIDTFAEVYSLTDQDSTLPYQLFRGYIYQLAGAAATDSVAVMGFWMGMDEE